MLAEVLQRVSDARDGAIGVEPSLVITPDSGWTPVAELVRAPYTLLDRLVERTAGRWNAPRHVGAALLWKAYGYWHTFPMALGWALDGRIPIMKFRDTYFRETATGISLGASRISWETGAAAIGAALAESQEPIVKVLSGMAKVGPRTLWGSTAEAMAHPLTKVVKGDYMRLLREVGKPVDGLVRPTEDGYFRRTCCLWVTLPDVEACSTCCIPSRN
ncbi:hypothetical protein GCM10009560_22000 [Nonomuraea longicatena]|uniref:(2Fe-2S)-binding protein n=1 Tax=Nonomuraea longicatena TaxID=83682 RepID=A0ABP3ZIB5_9ACTN